MQQFTAALHEDVLALLIQVTVLLLTARVLGEGARRLGQPPIVGEILAGVVLGPSLLSGLLPKIGARIIPEAMVEVHLWLIPSTQVQVHLLDAFSMLGALFMMLIAGLEIDLQLIRRHARSAIGTGFGGLSLAFIGGLIIAYFVIPDQFLARTDQRLVFSLFLAIAVSVSAIAVMAKILIDLNIIRRDFSQILLSAAMIGDAIAWMLISIFIGLAEGESITPLGIARSVINVLGFMILSFTLGHWFIKGAIRFVHDNFKVRDAMLSLVAVLMFAWSAISHSLHIEAVLGAFVVGIILSQMRNLPEHVVDRMESIAFGIFAPIFFAVAGLKVNLWSFLDLRLAAMALLIIVVSASAKIIGAYIGARVIAKRDHWTALSLGIGLNTQGAVEIIIASIALSKGIFTQDMFSIVVVMAVSSSLIAPTMLRWALRHVHMDEQEEQRLKHEEITRDNPFAHVHRVLVPVRRRQDDREGPEQMIESNILQNIATRNNISVTLLNVTDDDSEKVLSMAFLDKLSRIFKHMNVQKKVVVSKDPANAILDEARKGYDLLFMGSAHRQGNNTEVLFNPIIDVLVRMSPCPSIVVHANRVPHNWSPQRILAPTNGSLASRRSIQAAFSLVGGSNGEVLILKVVNMEAAMCYIEGREDVLERQFIISHQIVDELAAMGQSLGIKTHSSVHPGAEPEQVIMEVARSAHMDMIIMGTNIRQGSSTLYLGSRVERILNQAHCPVIIVNS